MHPGRGRLFNPWWLVTGLVLALCVPVFLSLEGRGFPDGHRTELDRAEIVLGKLFLGVSVPFALEPVMHFDEVGRLGA